MRDLDDSIDALLLQGERVLAHSNRVLRQVDRTLGSRADTVDTVIDLTRPLPEAATLDASPR